MARFFCLHLRDFAAWAAAGEMHCHQPLLVYCAGRVLAATPKARAAGIETGWPLDKARALAPEVRAVPYHAALVQAAWEDVLARLYEHTPCLESVQPGRAIFSLRRELAVEPLLRHLQARCGVADDRPTCELAALLAEPGTLCRVPPRGSARFLNQVPLDALCELGLGTDDLQHLCWFGWRTVGQLRQVEPRHLKTQFPEAAALLLRHAAASDARPVSIYAPPPYVAEREVFDLPASEPCQWQPALPLLCAGACAKLQNQAAHRVSLLLETAGATHNLHRMLRQPVSDAAELLRVLHLMLRDPLPALELQALEVRLGGLAPRPVVQQKLFGVQRTIMKNVLQAVEERHPGALQRIVTLNAEAYLPEESYRLEPAARQPQA